MRTKKVAKKHYGNANKIAHTKRLKELEQEWAIDNRARRFKEKMQGQHDKFDAPVRNRIIKSMGLDLAKMKQEHEKGDKLVEREAERARIQTTKLVQRASKVSAQTLKKAREFASKRQRKGGSGINTLRSAITVPGNTTTSSSACLWKASKRADEVGPIGPTIAHQLQTFAPDYGENRFKHLVAVAAGSVRGEVMMRFNYKPKETRLAKLVAYLSCHGVVTAWCGNYCMYFENFPSVKLSVEAFLRVEHEGRREVSKQLVYQSVGYGPGTVQTFPVHDNPELTINGLPTWKDKNMVIYAGYRYVLEVGHHVTALCDFYTDNLECQVPLVFIPFYD